MSKAVASSTIELAVPLLRQGSHSLLCRSLPGHALRVSLRRRCHVTITVGRYSEGGCICGRCSPPLYAVVRRKSEALAVASIQSRRLPNPSFGRTSPGVPVAAGMQTSPARCIVEVLNGAN